MTAVRGIVFATFLSLASCSHSLSPFPLEWRGVDTGPAASPSVADGLRRHVFHVAPFADTRPPNSPIAQVEDEARSLQTPTDVAAFCTKQFADLLVAAGARLGEGPTAVELHGEIQDFKVVEGNVYNGEARVHFSIQAGGQTSWEATYDGKDQRWGRSHSADNYNEALSNAFAQVVHHLLADDSFAKALSGP